jgi:pSer/pThr/pTyr-binding forkhead associated (FHA) protein
MTRLAKIEKHFIIIKMDEKLNNPSGAHLILKDQVFPLRLPTINIGRKLSNHLVIDDPRVSRLHAQIRVIDNEYYLVDLNSTGGTFVNEERISHAHLYGGDKLSFAGYEVQFVLETGGLVERTEDSTAPSKTAKKKKDETTKTRENGES